jgi:hypothetical protein
MTIESINFDWPCPHCEYNLRAQPIGHRCPECGRVIERPTMTSHPATSGFDRLNAFDRICAALAFVLAVVLIVLGAIGLFVGCQANFTLPPILGVLPLLPGWGILKCVIVAWRRRGITSRRRAMATNVPSIYRDPIPRTVADIDGEIDRNASPSGDQNA